MTSPPAPLEHVDARLTKWMARYGVTLLRVSLALVFLWFGTLKFFPGLSPAESLATRTMERLTGGAMGHDLALRALATWEVLIGLGLLFGKFMRIVLALLVLQMLGTLMPLILFPDEVFERFPFVLTLEGQFIIKNAVLISAAIVLGSTVRGGGLVAQPEVKEAADRVAKLPS